MLEKIHLFHQDHSLLMVTFSPVCWLSTEPCLTPSV